MHRTLAHIALSGIVGYAAKDAPKALKPYVGDETTFVFCVAGSRQLAKAVNFCAMDRAAFVYPTEEKADTKPVYIVTN